MAGVSTGGATAVTRHCRSSLPFSGEGKATHPPLMGALVGRLGCSGRWRISCVDDALNACMLSVQSIVCCAQSSRASTFSDLCLSVPAGFVRILPRP